MSLRECNTILSAYALSYPSILYLDHVSLRFTDLLLFDGILKGHSNELILCTKKHFFARSWVVGEGVFMTFSDSCSIYVDAMLVPCRIYFLPGKNKSLYNLVGCTGV